MTSQHGCALCGSKNTTTRLAVYGTPARANPGALLCEGCFQDHGGWDGCDAEITRRRSHPPAPSEKAWEPKPGERVAADHWEGMVIVGTFTGFDQGGDAWITEDTGRKRCVTPNKRNLRPAPPAAIPPAANGETYGPGVPDPLPERLPAGTRAVYQGRTRAVYQGNSVYVALDQCERRGDAYQAKWRHETDENKRVYETQIKARDIDWPSVKRPPPAAEGKAPEAPIAKPEPVEYHCRYCQCRLTDTNIQGNIGCVGGFYCDDQWCQGRADAEREATRASAKPDPYAGHRAELARSGMTEDGVFVWTPGNCNYDRDSRIAALSASNNPLDRLAAHRMRISAARSGREGSGEGRAEVSRHPSDWDVDDAPESYATSGWSGR